MIVNYCCLPFCYIQVCEGVNATSVSVINTKEKCKPPRSWRISPDGKLAAVGYDEGVLQVHVHRILHVHMYTHMYICILHVHMYTTCTYVYYMYICIRTCTYVYAHVHMYTTCTYVYAHVHSINCITAEHVPLSWSVHLN